MFVRFAARLVTAAVVLLVGSAAARCDLKIVTLTHVDCSKLLVNGAPVSADQMADLQRDPRFSADGVVTTVWVKGVYYRIDQLGLTTVTNTATGEVTVMDRVNKLYYTLSAGIEAVSADLPSSAIRLSKDSPSSVVFGYNARTTNALMHWNSCTLTCSALCTPELAALPKGLPIAIPAAADLLPRLTGLPLHLDGTVSMPQFVGQMHFDWQVTSLSTTTFERAELAPPADFKRIDPPNPSQGLHIAVEAQVAVDPAIAVPH